MHLVKVRSKNFSINSIRHYIKMPFKALIRFGSVTPTEKIWAYSNSVVEINSVEAIENSRSKLKMKACFAEAGVPQSRWWIYEKQSDDFYKPDGTFTLYEDLPYPILAKRIFGFKGKGMVKLDSQEQLEEWLSNNTTNGYYFEEYKGFAREYRLHVTKDGCFYAARKMLKEEAEDRWYRNDSNCIWITEYEVIKDNEGNPIKYNEGKENPEFDKPVNWRQIEADCIKALTACGLDTGAFDIKIQSAKDNKGNIRENPEYILIEVNSAPAWGVITEIKYKNILPKLLMDKYNEVQNPK